MRTKTAETTHFSGRLARAGLVLIFTMISTLFLQGGWIQPPAADAEVLNASNPVSLATTTRFDTAAYVVMQRIQVDSVNGGTNDGKVVLSTITIEITKNTIMRQSRR